MHTGQCSQLERICPGHWRVYSALQLAWVMMVCFVKKCEGRLLEYLLLHNSEQCAGWGCEDTFSHVLIDIVELLCEDSLPPQFVCSL